MLRFWILSFILAGFSQLPGQVMLTGKVGDESGAPIEAVTVYIHETGQSAITNQQGEFEFKSLQAGSYHIHLQRIGFAAADKSFLINNQAPVHLLITMQSSHVELSQAVVEESLLKRSQAENSQSTHMIGAEDFLKRGDFSLVKMLEQIPGVSSMNTGTGISKPVIRGMSFNRVVVAENGIRQEGQQWGGDHGLEIDQFGVERVEIVKGPASLLYGSDGIGGGINIRPAPIPELNSVKTSVLLTARSVNDFIGSSFSGAINKNNRFFRFRISTQDYGDFKVPASQFVYNTYVLDIVNNRLKNTAGAERNFTLSGGLSGKAGFSTLTFSKYDLHAGLFAGAHGIPRSYELKDDGNSRNIDLPKQRVEHYKLLSNSAILLGKNWLEIDLGYQFNHRREFSLPHAHGKGPQPAGNLELEFMLNTYSANLRYHLENAGPVRWVFGLQSQLGVNEIGGYQFLIPRFRQFSSGAFVFGKYEISEKFYLNGGLRYDYGKVITLKYLEPVYADSITISNYITRSPDLDRSFGNFSSSFGFSWFPAKSFNLKLNVARSFRMPTAQELTANGVHHGSFRHEMGDSSLSTEHGYQSDFSISFENKRTLVRITPYLNYYRNYIFLDPTAQFSLLPDAGLIYQFNQADAIHTGLELETDYHFSSRFHTGLSGQFVYAYNIENNYSLPFIPPGRLNVDIGYDFEKSNRLISDISIGSQVQLVADQFEVARNEPGTNGFALLNVFSSFQLKLGKLRTNWVFNIQNVLNTKYYAHLNRYRMLNLPEPGRNFLLTLQIPFDHRLSVNK
jgi:iron complex outermembrane receptor protein